MEVYMERALSINRQFVKHSMNEDFLDAMYRQYYKKVYNYIGFRINNHFDAEELASSVFENAVRKFSTYKPEVAPLEAWLIGIAKHVVTDYLRGKKRTFFVPLDEIVELVSLNRQPEDVVVMKAENMALMRAMAKLKDKERQVLSMKFATDLKNNEIAKLLHVSDSNVGVIIHRSIQKLKTQLEKENAGYEK